MNLAHIHLILNHVPVIGVPIAVAFLGYGLYANNKGAQRFALIALVAITLCVIPVYLSGEPAEDVVEKLPGVADTLIETHEGAATVSMILTLIAGATALVSLFFAKNEKRFRIGSLTALIIAIIATMSLAYTANLGGKVRHTEVRSAPESTPSSNKYLSTTSNQRNQL